MAWPTFEAGRTPIPDRETKADRSERLTSERCPSRISHPDWRHIAAALAELPRADTEKLFGEQGNLWSEAAARIFALRSRTGKPRHQLDFALLRRSRKWAGYVDARWRSERRLTSIERRALLFAIEHWDGARSQVRFGSRPLAVAWRDLLADPPRTRTDRPDESRRNCGRWRKASS